MGTVEGARHYREKNGVMTVPVSIMGVFKDRLSKLYGCNLVYCFSFFENNDNFHCKVASIVRYLVGILRTAMLVSLGGARERWGLGDSGVLSPFKDGPGILVGSWGL